MSDTLAPTDGWEVRTVGSLGSVRGGKRLPKGRSLTVTPTAHPYIRVTDMRQGQVDTSNLRFVPEDVAPAIRAYRIFSDDIFVSVAGTLGIVGRVPVALDGASLTENADRITSIDCDVDYLMYALQSESIQNEIDSIRTVGAQPKLALGRIKKFKIQIPCSRAEQDLVASALRDTDDLISSFERQISKKKSIRQGMMQQLLTGRTRLAGFNEAWSAVQLSSVATGSRGAGLSKSVLDGAGEASCVLYGELFTKYGRVISEVQSRTNSSGTVRSAAGQVLLPGSTTTVAEDLAVATAILQDGVLLGGDINIITPMPDFIDPVWLAYFLTSQRRQQIAQSAQGLTIVHLYVRGILAVEISLPSLREQRAIAAALTDADSEIEILSERLEKARAIKHGMMQQLLTGRTRLPVEAAE